VVGSKFRRDHYHRECSSLRKRRLLPGVEGAVSDPKELLKLLLIAGTDCNSVQFTLASPPSLGQTPALLRDSFQIVPMARGAIPPVQLRSLGSLCRSQRLYRLQIFHQILQSYISSIHIRFHLVKDGSPDRHFPRAVSGYNPLACDRLSHLLGGEAAFVV